METLEVDLDLIRMMRELRDLEDKIAEWTDAHPPTKATLVVLGADMCRRGYKRDLRDAIRLRGSPLA